MYVCMYIYTSTNLLGLDFHLGARAHKMNLHEGSTHV